MLGTLTKAKIEGIQPGPKIAAYPDVEVKNLSLVVLPSGRKTFSLFYRFNRKPRRIRVGVFGDPISPMSLQEARLKARKLLNRIASGDDPGRPDEVKEADTLPTMEKLCDEFEQNYIETKLRLSSQADYKSMLRKWVRPEWGSRLVKDVTKADVSALHAKMSAKQPKAKGDPKSREAGGRRRANFMLAIVGCMLTYAIEKKYRADNPCKGIQKNPEPPRSRYLSEAELGRLMAALDASLLPSAKALKLLLLTGARRGEILGAEWSQFDLDAATPTWTKPASLTKQKKEHRIPLNGPATAVLKAMRKKSGGKGYLFPSKDGNPQQGLKRAWETICKTAKITGVRVHDLRHSYASILVNSGASLPTIGALLGHSEVATTQRYAHLMDATLKEATEQAGATINAALASGGKKSLSKAA